MKIDILELYKAILEPQGIHILFLNEPYTYIEKTDFGFRNHIFKNYNYKILFQVLEKTTDSFPVLFFKDDLMVEYCLLLFPKKWKEQYQATHLLIGPVLFEELSGNDVSSLLERHQLSSTLYRDFMQYYNRIPHLPSRDFWISLLTPLLDEIFEGNSKHEYFEFNNQFTEDFELKESSFSFETIEARYKAEQQLLNAVQVGDLKKAIAAHQNFQRFRFALRATDSLRSRKNLTLTLNTLLRKAIEASHVHPYYIDHISSEFSFAIENAINEPQLEALVLRMIRKYCNLAKNYSTKNLSALVEKCVHQIQFHYAEPLSLDILARDNSVSTSYLSNLFHKETGKTITQFINETRIDCSIRLLNTSNLSISEIALLCGFSDANYFTRTFKKIKGISPMTYRKTIHIG